MFQFAKGVISSMIIGDSEVPQTVQESGAQARNSAGGFSFVLDDMARVRRFLKTLTQVTTRYSRRASALESADLRHENGYAVRLRGVSTNVAAAPKK